MSAQILPYTITGSNGYASTASNLPTVITTSGPMTSQGYQTTIPYSGGYAHTPTSFSSGTYLSNSNLANAVTNANLVNANAVNSYFDQDTIGQVNANFANNNLATSVVNANTVADVVNNANAIIAADNAANNLVSANYAYENILANTEDMKQANNLSPVLNGNMATFYLGNNGNTFSVTSGSPGTQGIGVQVMADALEVGGTVVVNGRIPIYGMVGINGNIPTDGMASVSYSCANPSTLL
ncbi:unnamed protein product [Parnassius apollo]|uniref:(apollo) hypothetical protein n=1 Tax=Parnassius apollo TaxID=110799 RepID=A0A8S3WGN2_PARAO|nr:unnamed protein product [Parnassius apollo]